MPYDEEDPPFLEPDAELNEITGKIIGASYEVYNELGPGLDDALYREALCREMTACGLSFQCEVWIDVQYKGNVIGRKRLDLLVAGRVIVELKAVEQLSALHKAQLRTYLKVMGARLGLLINFNAFLLRDEIKRILNPNGK